MTLDHVDLRDGRRLEVRVSGPTDGIPSFAAGPLTFPSPTRYARSTRLRCSSPGIPTRVTRSTAARLLELLPNGQLHVARRLDDVASWTGLVDLFLTPFRTGSGRRETPR